LNVAALHNAIFILLKYERKSYTLP